MKHMGERDQERGYKQVSRNDKIGIMGADPSWARRP